MDPRYANLRNWAAQANPRDRALASIAAGQQPSAGRPSELAVLGNMQAAQNRGLTRDEWDRQQMMQAMAQQPPQPLQPMPAAGPQEQVNVGVDGLVTYGDWSHLPPGGFQPPPPMDPRFAAMQGPRYKPGMPMGPQPPMDPRVAAMQGPRYKPGVPMGPQPPTDPRFGPGYRTKPPGGG